MEIETPIGSGVAWCSRDASGVGGERSGADQVFSHTDRANICRSRELLGPKECETPLRLVVLARCVFYSGEFSVRVSKTARLLSGPISLGTCPLVVILVCVCCSFVVCFADAWFTILWLYHRCDISVSAEVRGVTNRRPLRLARALTSEDCCLLFFSGRCRSRSPRSAGNTPSTPSRTCPASRLVQSIESAAGNYSNSLSDAT